MAIRLLHAADLHLGAPLRNFGELSGERRRDFLKTFDKIVNQAIKREVDCLVIAGDLFDSNQVDSEVIGRVQDAFSRLDKRGIAVVLIPGTHDHVASADSIFVRYTFPEAHLLMEPEARSPLTLTLKGQPVHFYGFAFRSGHGGDPLASMKRRDGEGVHVGLLHGSLKGSPEWDMRRKDLPFSIADLAGLGLDYIALGHYHDFAQIEAEGRVLACYPGTPEGKKFGENGPRHVALVEIADGRVTVEKVAVQTRSLAELTVDASLFPEPGALEGELARLATPDTLARVRLTGTVEEPIDTSLLAGRLQGRYAWLDLVDLTDLYDSALVQRLAREDSIRGMLVRKANGRLAQCENEDERELCREALKLLMGRFVQGRGA